MSINNIEKTKNSLKVAFSVIVFVTVLLMGLTYFTTKYIHETRNEKNDFKKIIELAKSNNFRPESIGNGLMFESSMGQRHMGQGQMRIRMMREGGNINFMNYVLIKNGNEVISSNIKDDIPEDLILDSLENDKYYSVIQDFGFLVGKMELDDGILFIAYKKLSYSFGDYYKDVIGFLFITILFTALVYLIGNGFVNKVFVPVEENMKDMNDFIHNAGHELKTPISVIDSNIQLMLDMKIYDEEMILEQKKEILKLNSLIDSLVDLSDFDTFENFTKLNLKESIEEVLSDFKNKIKDKKIKITTDIKKNITIEANNNYFYIFISNIIGNAIKYNKNKGEIDITYKTGRLIIQDSGVGIKYEDLDKIFNRFYKGDESRSTEGFGIGLSLVKRVADLYKWEINVESKEGEGTKFMVRF